MKTVTVRIPVAVDAAGKWCSTYGSDDTLDEVFQVRIQTEAEDYSLSLPSIVWVTAEVPVPEPTEVEGRVE